MLKFVYKMKVALLLPAEPEKAPYIQYYIDVFKEKGIEYDVIAWNRSGNNPKVLERLIMYEAPSPDTLSNIKKVRGFWGFKQFVEKTVRQKQYDRLVVHTIMLAVFMSSFLKQYYGGKYILDIRDECSLYGIMKLRLPVLLKYSFCNVISSWGFKTWLPEAEYVISHNIGFRWKEKMNMPAPDSFFHHQPLDILTIGQIRHFDGTRILIDELGNRGNMKMHFAGDGVDVSRLVEYCKEKKINNVVFSGRYLKENEDDIVSTSDFVNILLPQTRVQQAMANRFYLAILNYKPVIVNAESIQAEYVRKYGLGIVWELGTSLKNAIEDYIARFDIEQFLDGRRKLCETLMKDVMQFNKMLNDIL